MVVFGLLIKGWDSIWAKGYDMSNLDRRPRDGRLTLYMVGMVEQHGLWWHLLADTAGLVVAMPKKGFWAQFSTGLPPTWLGQCGEPVFLTSREWQAATPAGDDGVSRVELAVIEGNLRCSFGNDDCSSGGVKACRRSTRRWFGLGCGIAVWQRWRVELGFAARIWWNWGSTGWLFIVGIDPGRSRHGLLVFPTEICLQIAMFEDKIQMGKFSSWRTQTGSAWTWVGLPGEVWVQHRAHSWTGPLPTVMGL
jgi:hypothetical protein